jgi:D-alanyl-D-alanine carboxypeptidase/D-alanyl-D-alanine-endopeptidase (penicillin-binding protein 4)
MYIKSFFQSILLILSVILLLNSCAPVKKYALQLIKGSEKQNFFIGFMLYDPEKKKTLAQFNSHKYFIPASTVKIMSLYTSLNLLGDSIPTLKWIEKNDSLFIKGTGDPTLLDPWFKSDAVINFINSATSENVILQSGNFNDDKWGPGWSWEDYAYYFMPEKSSFPMYGNVVTVHASGDSLKITPKLFSKNFTQEKSVYARDIRSNHFYIPNNRIDTLQIPYITSDSLTLHFLSTLTTKKVSLGEFSESEEAFKTLFSLPSESVYQRMMKVSDNFLAEQLMILCSGMLSDTLAVKKTIDHSLANLIPDIPQYPRWVDGSGLSRYNLFSPHDFIYVLHKMHQEYDEEKLFNLFPKVKLLENDDKNKNLLLYAKTGSFSNNYCLSGYLITKSGKTLIFSFMANHFTIPTPQVKQEFYELLSKISERY